MRIVKRPEFLTLPAGTVFCRYEPINFGDIEVKGDTTLGGDDFYSQVMNGCIQHGDETHGGSDTWVDAWRRAEKGEEIPMDFNVEIRDADYDSDRDEQMFCIWSKEDVERLIVRLRGGTSS